MKTKTFCGWTPIQIARHYDFPLERTGKGQKAAIISLGGKINEDDLAEDFQALRLPIPTLRVVTVDPDAISAEQDAMGSGETQLDVQILGCLCPDAEITIYRGPNPSGLAAAIDQAVKDGNKVISVSWGAHERAADSFCLLEMVLAHAKSQGVTVCVCVGDGGSADSRLPSGGATTASDGKAHVEYPASSAYVLACGGTELHLHDDRAHEIVWNAVPTGGGATGGGVSEVFARPSWQQKAGIDIRSANTGKSGRVVPDVAGLAVGGAWRIYQAGEAHLSGGTSAVAPLWASLFVLVNEARAAAGRPPLGFVNERLYALAREQELFIDIVDGHNAPAKDYPGYAATSGFDACTGWGSPHANRLFAALCRD